MQDTWLRGLHLTFDHVAMGKIDMPPRHLISVDCPAFFKKKHGFNAVMVRDHFASAPRGDEPTVTDDLYIALGITEVEHRPPPKQKKHYELSEMLVFEDIRANNPSKTLNACITLAKQQLPQMFLARTKYETFEAFPARIKKIREKEKAAVLKEQKKKEAAKKRRLSRKDAPSVADKKEEVEVIFEKPAGAANNQVVPSSLFVGLAMLLYAQYLAGVPLTASLALPVIVAYFRAMGHGHLLHSKQTSFPLDSTMKKEGIDREKGRVFWTKRAVNHFFRKIGMGMRRGTCNHGKSKQPEEVEGLRKPLGLCLLYVMVTKLVHRFLVFQLDETGVDLLPMHDDRGRAQEGVAEVSRALPSLTFTRTVASELCEVCV